VPIAANLTSVSGGSTARSIDLDLKGPYVDEYTVGLDVGLNRVMTVQFNYVKKLDGRGNKTLNLALPYDAYTVAATGVDPGRDNTPGTDDDQSLLIYSVPRTYATFGQVIERVIQTGESEGRNKYDAYGVTFNKQLSNNYSFLVSYNLDYRDLADNDPRNPNEALYGPASAASGTNANTYTRVGDSWNHAVRISGNYQLPWGLMYGSSFTAQSGDYFVREAQIRDALNQTITIRVESQAGRYGWVKLWDNRISKRFSLPRNQSIEGMIDLFNSLNDNTVTSQTNRNGSTYLRPTEIIAPRVFRLGVRYKF